MKQKKHKVLKGLFGSRKLAAAFETASTQENLRNSHDFWSQMAPNKPGSVLGRSEPFLCCTVDGRRGDFRGGHLSGVDTIILVPNDLNVAMRLLACLSALIERQVP